MKKIIYCLLPLIAILALAGCSKQPNVVSVSVVTDNGSTQTGTVAATPSVSSSSAVAAKPAAPKPSTPAPSTPIKQTAEIPAKFLMEMAFSRQAPFGNWDEVHEETCEEASMIMVDKYFKRQPLSEQIMEDELQKILAWLDRHGYKVDLTAQETVDVMKAFYGLSARVSRNVTVDQIKYELSQGHPIIIPVAGRELHNPNFTGLGPVYHMLVIKGYDEKNFITNDPGTRKGNGYTYSYDTIINAIHDWNHDFDGAESASRILTGEKVMIVVDR